MLFHVSWLDSLAVKCFVQSKPEYLIESTQFHSVAELSPVQ
jgi:hypothetical protein